MRSLLRFIIGLGLASALAGYGGYLYLMSWSEASIPLSAETLLELRPGQPLKTLASNLETKNLISDARLFWVWMKITRDYPRLQAGTYQFTQSVSPAQIRQKLITGDAYIPLVLQVAIPEGFTLKMLNNRLATKNVGKLSDLRSISTDRKFIRSLGIQSSSLEGFTYPATYSFDKMPDGREFYKKTVKTFFERLPPDYEAQITKRGLSLTQAVTMASLIELETMREEEKPMIAEVIWSRLKNGEPLGIDAAIIYGIDGYDGDLKWKDLKNTKNPYTTRLHRGLPPTPIGAVSKSSLVAVLNPTNLGYYYYVLDSADQTRHVFSKTLNEHNALVN